MGAGSFRPNALLGLISGPFRQELSLASVSNGLRVKGSVWGTGRSTWTPTFDLKHPIKTYSRAGRSVERGKRRCNPPLSASCKRLRTFSSRSTSSPNGPVLFCQSIRYEYEWGYDCPWMVENRAAKQLWKMGSFHKALSPGTRIDAGVLGQRGHIDLPPSSQLWKIFNIHFAACLPSLWASQQISRSTRANR